MDTLIRLYSELSKQALPMNMLSPRSASMVCSGVLLYEVLEAKVWVVAIVSFQTPEARGRIPG